MVHSRASCACGVLAQALEHDEALGQDGACACGDLAQVLGCVACASCGLVLAFPPCNLEARLKLNYYSAMYGRGL